MVQPMLNRVLRQASFSDWSGYMPLCFRSAALVGGYSDVTLPYLAYPEQGSLPLSMTGLHFGAQLLDRLR
eukprot:1149439-Pelagomonas_calceolata.AAC.6